MLGGTHFVFGMASALVITHPQTVPGIITAMTAGAIGGWIVDIDLKNRDIQRSEDAERESIFDAIIDVLFILAFIAVDYLIGKGMCQYVIDNWGVKVWGDLFGIAVLLLIGLNTKHRTFTHSFLATALFTGLVYLFCRPATIPFFIGYASHLVADFFNKLGLQLFFPLKWRLCLKRCRSDKKATYETAKTELSAGNGGIAAGQIKLRSAFAEAIEDYKYFIRSKNNSYKIYDIDKDGYPELFFSELHYQEREAFTDIYIYSDGEFTHLDRTYDFIFWQAFPKYASYPNGNGIVQYARGRGKETVSVEKWVDGVNRSDTAYQTDFIQDHIDRDQMYYKDVNDDAYETEINHQFYQSETSCPYFEGSYLLGLSAKDNFTAVYEAFGVEAVGY